MFNQEHGNRHFFFQVWCISASRTWCRLACSSRKSNMYSMASSRAEPQWCWRWFGRRHPWSSVACPWWPEAALGTFRRLSCYLSHHSAVLGSHGSWTRALLLFISKSALPMFSSGSSMVSGLFISLTHFIFVCDIKCRSESHSVVSDSLRSRRLYSPWNSPSQNTGVGNRSSQPRDRTQVSHIAGRFFTCWAIILLPVAVQFSSTAFFDCLFSIVYSCLFCHWLIDQKYMIPNSPSSSIDLCVCLASTTIFWLQ